MQCYRSRTITHHNVRMTTLAPQIAMQSPWSTTAPGEKPTFCKDACACSLAEQAKFGMCIPPPLLVLSFNCKLGTVELGPKLPGAFGWENATHYVEMKSFSQGDLAMLFIGDTYGASLPPVKPYPSTPPKGAT